MEMGQMVAEIHVLTDERSPIYLDWDKEYDEVLNGFFAHSPFCEWGIFARPSDPMSIFVIRGDSGETHHMGTWNDGKWCYTITRNGEKFERELHFRITHHFNLRPGDVIRITTVQ